MHCHFANLGPFKSFEWRRDFIQNCPWRPTAPALPHSHVAPLPWGRGRGGANIWRLMYTGPLQQWTRVKRDLKTHQTTKAAALVVFKLKCICNAKGILSSNWWLLQLRSEECCFSMCCQKPAFCRFSVPTPVVSDHSFSPEDTPIGRGT